MKKMNLFLLAALAFTACKKDKTENPENQFTNFVAAHKSENQLFTLNAASGGTITGKKGSVIKFPAAAFTDADGNPVTGEVIVTLNESLTRDAWIMDALSTEANGALLRSGGMIKITAKRKADGAELQPAPAMRQPNAARDSVIMAEVPRNGNPDLGLFLQKPVGGAAGNPQTTWAAAPYYPFGNGPNSYIFQLPEFRWVNCDGLWNDPRPKTTVRVIPDLTGISGASDLQACFVYRNINTVITLPPQAGYFESYSNSIPEGSQADILLIGKNGSNQILFKVLPANTFTTGQQITLKPEVATAAGVNAYLNSVR